MSINTQQGMVLLISLIFLLVFTLLGVTAMQVSFVAERIATNSRQNLLAVMAGQTALVAAQHALQQQDTRPLPQYCMGACRAANGLFVIHPDDEQFDQYVDYKALSNEDWLRRSQPFSVSPLVKSGYFIRELDYQIDPVANQGQAVYQIFSIGLQAEQARHLVQVSIVKVYPL